MENKIKTRIIIASVAVVTAAGICVGACMLTRNHRKNEPHPDSQLQAQASTTPTATTSPNTTPSPQPKATTHEHSYIAEKKAATCTSEGYTLHACSCGDTYRTDEMKAKGHKYGVAKQTEATCTAKGGLVRTCETCGHKDIENAVAALGHSWSAWEITKEATTSASGQKVRTCDRCNKTEKKTIVKIKATEPTTKPTETKPPTKKPRLDSVGRIIGSACDICGKPVGDWCRAGVCMQWPFSRYCTCCGAFVFGRKCHHCTVPKYVVKYCDRCGKRYGDGANGTCIGWLIDMTCPKCGKEVPAHTCHTCSE